jgi:hypothetical protein
LSLDEIKKLKEEIVGAYNYDLQRGRCLRISEEDMPEFLKVINARVTEVALASGERQLQMLTNCPEDCGLQGLEKIQADLEGLFSFGQEKIEPKDRDRIRDALQAAACRTAERGLRLFEKCADYRTSEEVKGAGEYLCRLYSFAGRKMTDEEKLGLEKVVWQISMKIQLNAEPASIGKVLRLAAFDCLRRGDAGAKAPSFYHSAVYAKGVRPVCEALLAGVPCLSPKP